MNLQELKIRELGLLNTHRDRYVEYGVAYTDIRKICENFSGPKLSDGILISEIAQQYALKEKKLYDLTKDKKHLMHIKAASELFKKEFVSFNVLFDFFSKQKRNIKFEEAKHLLSQTSFYDRVNPQTLVDVLQFIEMNAKEE